MLSYGVEHADYVQLSEDVCTVRRICKCIVEICVCVCVYTEWGGDDVSACRLPFIEIPRVAAVFPSPQEMTRRVSA